MGPGVAIKKAPWLLTPSAGGLTVHSLRISVASGAFVLALLVYLICQVIPGSQRLQSSEYSQKNPRFLTSMPLSCSFCQKTRSIDSRPGWNVRGYVNMPRYNGQGYFRSGSLMELRGAIEKRHDSYPYSEINKNCVKLYFGAKALLFARADAPPGILPTRLNSLGCGSTNLL